MSAMSCRLCGTALVRVADPGTDEYVWAGPDGLPYGRDRDLADIPDPYGRLAELAELAGTGDRAAIREYTALKTRLDAGGTWHTHRADARTLPPHEGPVPHCCGWPGWLRPSGWQCRRCGRRLPVPEPVQAPVPVRPVQAGGRSR